MLSCGCLWAYVPPPPVPIPPAAAGYTCQSVREDPFSAHTNRQLDFRVNDPMPQLCLLWPIFVRPRCRVPSNPRMLSASRVNLQCTADRRAGSSCRLCTPAPVGRAFHLDTACIRMYPVGSSEPRDFPSCL